MPQPNLTIKDLDAAEEIAAIPFEMSGKVRQLLADYERLAAGLVELEKRLRSLAEKQAGRRTAQKMIMIADELAALRGNDGTE